MAQGFRTPVFQVYFACMLLLIVTLARPSLTDSGHTISLSEDDAYHIACSYWNYKSGDIDEETGFELFLINDGIVEDQNYGKSYYEFRLRWLVENHLSTIDTVYIDAETGNCYSDIPT